MAADLSFRIGAELTEIKGALAALRKDFAATGAAAQQAGGKGTFGGIEKGLGSAVAQVKTLIAGLVGVAAAVKLIAAADELNTLNARLKLVTASSDEFAQAQVKLFELAQRSRASLAETIKLYAQIANATKDAGVGQETLLGIVETINQAVQLSGASTQAAEAALIQLGQGLASGALRGEELNSVLEQTPALADAIAKGLGVTRGELRQLGQDGKITAEQVIKALQAQRDEVASKFAQLPITVGQSLTLLRNAGLQLLGTFDTVTGATGGLANVIRDLSEFLSSDAVIGAVITFSATWSGAFEQIVGDAREALKIIRGATTDIVGSGEDIVDIVGRAFVELPTNVRTSIKIVAVRAAELFDGLVSYARFVKDNFKAIFTDDTQDAALARFQARNRAIAAAAQETVEDALSEREKALADAKKIAADAAAAREKARTSTGSTSSGTFTTKLSDAQKREAEALRKAQLDAEEKLFDDSTKRQLGILDQYFSDAKIATADYYRAREAIELGALDRSIDVEKRRLAAATSGADRVKALAQIEILERQKGDIEERGRIARVKAERETSDQLVQLRADDIENQGRAAEAAGIRLEARFRDLRERLVIDGNQAAVDLVDRLIDTGKTKARFDEIKAQFDRVIADLQSRQQQIADQRNAGALAPDIASQQASEARRTAEIELQRINAQLQELAKNVNDPAIKRGAEESAEALRRLAIDGATGLDGAVIELRASLANLREGLAKTAVNSAVDGLTNLFAGLADGSKSLGQGLKDFARSFAASMAQIAARALATIAVLSLLEAIFPGAGRLIGGGGGGGVSAGVNHSGGMAGTGPRRMVNPLVFAGAPRFHGGGLVGLKPDERPAILQTGERVLNRQETSAYNGGGSGGGTRVINVIDPALVQDYMTSSAGERTILNVIERNAGAVRQKIA